MQFTNKLWRAFAQVFLPGPLKTRRTFLARADHCYQVLEYRHLLATITYDGGGSDPTIWGDRFNWTGDTLPGPGDDAVINLVNSNPTITVSSNQTINSLVSEEALTLSNGTLSVTTNLQVNNTFLIAGGTLANATVLAGTGGQGISATNNSANRLTGVTLNGELSLNSAGSRVKIEGGTTFTTARLSASNAGLGFAPGSVITGNIIFDGSGGNRNIGMNLNSGTLTIDPAATLETAAGFTGNVNIGDNLVFGFSNMTLDNQGTIASSISGQTVTVSSSNLTNTGTIEATNGGLLVVSSTAWLNDVGGQLDATASTLTLGGNWDNDGTITSDASTLNLGGTFTTADVGTLNRTNGGTVFVTGTMDNSAGPLTLNTASGSWRLNGGTISGGVIDLLNGEVLSATNNSANRLTGVTLNGELSLNSAGSRVKIEGGTTFTTARLSASNAGLGFAPGSVITGNIIFDGSSGDRNIGMNANSGTLTIDPAATLETAAGFTGNVKIGDNLVFGFSNMTLDNQGTIASSISGRTVTVSSSNLTNTGTIEATNAGLLVVSSTAWLNDVGGQIDATASTLTLGGNWDNDGTITSDASTLNLGGTFTTADVGTLNRTNGGTVFVTGTMDNSAGPLTLNTASGSWRLNGGTISGGVIDLLDGEFLSATNNSANRLTGVTLNGELSLNSSGSRVKIEGGTTFTTARLSASNAGLGFAPGSVITGNIIFDGGGGNRNIGMNGNSGTLTIDPAATLETAAGLAGFTGNVLIGDNLVFGFSNMTLDNQGTIASSISGRTVTVSSSNLTNTGTIEATNGGLLVVSSTAWLNDVGGQLDATASTLTLGGNWDNDGTITSDASTLNLGGTFTTADVGTLNRTNGGTVFVTGTMDNSAGPLTLNTASGSWRLNAGTISGGVIDLLNGEVLSVTNNSANRLTGVTVDGELSLNSAGSRVKIEGGTTFTTARLSASNAGLGFAPGSVITGNIIFDGGSGNRNIGMNANSGTLTIDAAATLEAAAGFTGSVQIGDNLVFGFSNMTLDNQGTIASSISGRTVTVSSSNLTNTGTIEATNGGLIDLTTTPDNYNGLSETLTGGSWLALSGGDLRWPSGSLIQNVAATIVVDGAGSTLEAGSGIDALTNLATVSASGDLTLANGGNLVTIGPLDVAGSLNVGESTTLTINLGDQLIVSSGGTLGGRGTISGPVTAQGGANVAPGNSPGILNTGNFTFSDNSIFEVEIGGTTPGNTDSNHDQLNVTGTVTIGNNVSLNTSQWNGFAPQVGNQFVIINNDSTDAIMGTGIFAGLPEGAAITNFLGSGLSAIITYAGGADSNDVVLTVQSQTTLSVSNLNDAGAGSLRQAIIDSNTSTGVVNTIEFSVAGTIELETDLPTITDPVFINGYSAPGASPNTLAVGSDAVITVELDGSAPMVDSATNVGLAIDADNVEIRGLAIRGFGDLGIIDGTLIQIAAGRNNAVIAGNHLGTDLAGTVPDGSRNAVNILGGTGHVVGGSNVADRNVISGNDNAISIFDNAANITIAGNYIGVDADGVANLGNGGSAIYIDSSSPDSINNIFIGGTTVAERNVLSGNNGDGITLNGDGISDVFITGNYIGTNAAGTAAVDNDADGIKINDATDITIGGFTNVPGTVAGNLISGNSNDGIELDGASNVTIVGNLIGTNAVGDDAVGNTRFGLHVRGGSNIEIGGDDIADGALDGINKSRNIISGNILGGIKLDQFADLVNIRGNYIGTDIDADFAVANGNSVSTAGIGIINAKNVTIGGTTSDAGNIISGNTGIGIVTVQPNLIDQTLLIQGNYIGVGFDGSTARPNGAAGIRLGSLLPGSVTIGGSVAGAGNVISGNSAEGIVAIAASGGHTIAGNYIGLDATGTIAVGNGQSGISLASDSNTVGGTTELERNVISANAGGAGIAISGENNVVIGNYLGTDYLGTSNATFGNQIEITLGGASFNTIGGATAGERNVIGGGGSTGIRFTFESNNNEVYGNYIKVDATGDTELGNGIAVSIARSINNQIGGPLAGQRNIIGRVVQITGGNDAANFATSGNKVQGNYIGIGVSGAALGSFLPSGVTIELEAYNNIIGTDSDGSNDASEGNVISGRNVGVVIRDSGTDGNVVAGNLIGTNPAGDMAIGNSSWGVLIDGGASGNIVGGTSTAARNTISGNALAGVSVRNGFGNRIVGNYVGLNAAGDGVLPNGNGIEVENASPLIENNFITGNEDYGILVDGQGMGVDDSAVIWLDGEGNADDKLGLNNGTLLNGVAFDTGVSGQGFLFDTVPNGVNEEEIRISHDTSLDLTQLTIDLWFRMDSAPTSNPGGSQVLVSKGISGTGENYGLYLLPDGSGGAELTFENYNGGFRQYTTSGAGLVVGQIYHAAATVSSSTVSLYIDGQLVDEFALTHGLLPNTGDLQIGNNQPSYGNRFDGLIDELAIYNTALSDQQIAAIHAMGGSGKQGTVIRGNKVGNLTALAGNGTGIALINSAGNIVGGTNAVNANVISGNVGDGVVISGSGSVGNILQGNFIGTSDLNQATIGNGRQGLLINGGASHNLIGGPRLTAGNVISGNDNDGLQIADTGTSYNVVVGNDIGTSAGGGSALGNGRQGVLVNFGATNNTIGGEGFTNLNVISANAFEGVQLADAGTSFNRVLGNYIGLSLGGGDLGNGGAGVLINFAASDNIIGSTNPDGRNIISWNDNAGVFISDTGTNANRLENNWIGVGVEGDGDLGNAGAGVLVQNNAAGNFIGTPGAGNVVSGNDSNGIWVLNSSGNFIDDNIVGLASDGDTLTGNAFWGISIEQSPDNEIGVQAGNTVSGNNNGGILVIGVNSTDNIVQNNYAGTDVTGQLDRGNVFSGILVGDFGDPVGIGAASNTLIGGAVGTGNLVSGNGDFGVWVSNARDTKIASNLIGTDIDAEVAIPNDFYGVYVNAGSTGTEIGDSVTGDGNLISGNAEYGIGVWQTETDDTTIDGNLIGLSGDGNETPLGNTWGIWVGFATNTHIGTNFGNVISGNIQGGITVAGATAASTVIQNNYIGTDSAGDTSIGNTGSGVWIGDFAGQFGLDSANGVLIGGVGAGNVISGNTGEGILLSSNDNIVAGNLIGLSADGNTPIGNATKQVRIVGDNNLIGTDGDDVDDVAERNFIVGVGSGEAAIQIETTAQFNRVSGNFIGLNGTGDLALGGYIGIDVRGDDNFIGTDGDGSAGDANEGNVISGHFQIPSLSSGVTISGQFNVVAGNLIGTNAAGSDAAANYYGVRIVAPNNRIGTDGDGTSDLLERNVISGNIVGIYNPADNTTIAGNYIGLNAAGTNAIGNVEEGIDSRGTNNVIGTDGDGSPGDDKEGNVISGNVRHGIWLRGGSNQIIAGNLIGLDAGGQNAVGNLGVGVFLSTDNNRIGSDNGDFLERNVISGNLGSGIFLDQTTGNVIDGNYIGTDFSGSTGIGNGSSIDEVADPGIYVNNANPVISNNVIADNEASGIKVAGNSGIDDSAISWYKGEDANDSVGSNNGVLIGNADIATGLNGKAFSFDGGSGHVALPGTQVGDLDLTGTSVSVEAWVNLTNYTQTNPQNLQTIFDKFYDGISNNGYRLGLIDGRIEWRVSTDANANFVANSAQQIPLDTWTHVAGTYDGSIARVFINGQEVLALAHSGNILHNSLDARIGNDNGGSSAFGLFGKIDDLAVYGGSLTATQIEGIVARNGYAKRGAVISGNYIGTNAAASIRIGNEDGIKIENSSGTLIGGSNGAITRNVISGNSNHGIYVSGAGSDSNAISGNYVGISATGAALGNESNGIFIRSGASHTLVGGSTDQQRNVISGNWQNGVSVVQAGAGNVIRGNYIGTDPSGSTAVGNGADPAVSASGVSISSMSSNSVIVGTDGDGVDDASEGNLISGNFRHGVRIQGGFVSHVIAGNLIGTRISGTEALPNQGDAVVIVNSGNNRIGTNSDGVSDELEGNVIAASRNLGLNPAGPSVNPSGLVIIDTDIGNEESVSDNVVAGNFIGTDRTATASLGNQAYGILMNRVAGNTIGGTNSIAANVIAYSGFDGLRIFGTDEGGLVAETNNTVNQNFYFGNLQSAIDLGPAGVTPNDDGDVDDVLNFPVITSATIESGLLTITGFAAPGATFELYKTDPSASGFGQGNRFLGEFAEGSTAPGPGEDLDSTSGTASSADAAGLPVGTFQANRFRFEIPLENVNLGAGTTLAITPTVQTYSDDEFNLEAWDVSTFSLGAGDSFSVTQQPAGGNPGAYRQIDLDILPAQPGSTSVLAVNNFSKSSAYNPQLQGAISSFDLSLDFIRQQIDPLDLRFGPAVRQDGIVYTIGTASSATTWGTLTWNDLVATDLVREGGPVDSHPDFSESGSPIEFGFYFSGTLTDLDTSSFYSYGFDNWSVAVRSPVEVTLGNLVSAVAKDAGISVTRTSEFGNTRVVSEPGLDAPGSSLAPVIPTLANVSLLTGETLEQTVIFEDADSTSWTAQVDYGDGTIESLDASDRNLTLEHDYLTAGEYTVTITVYDDDQQSSTGQFSVSVFNESPNVEFNFFDITSPVVEGETVTLTGQFADSGLLDSHNLLIDWGDGTIQPVLVPVGARDFVATHQYQDDVKFDENGFPVSSPLDVYRVDVSVTDQGGLVDSTPIGSLLVEVRNVAPSSLNISLLPTSIDEGQSVSLGGSFVDPGSGLEEKHRLRINWGDGSDVQVVDLPVGDRTFSGIAHIYADDPTIGLDQYLVTVDLFDDDEPQNRAQATRTITVINVAPTVTNLTVNPNAPIDENGTVNLSGAFSDPGLFDSHRVVIEWGDGSSNDSFGLDPGVFSFAGRSHQYLDDLASGADYTITVQVFDNDSATEFGSSSIDVTVNNVDPEIAVGSIVFKRPDGTVLGSGESLNEGDTILIEGSFTDVGSLDRHQVEIEWNDGSLATLASVNSQNRTFSAIHTFVDDNMGISNIVVNVTDDDSGSASLSVPLTVNNVAPTASIVPDTVNNNPNLINLLSDVEDLGINDLSTMTYQWEATFGTNVQVNPDPAEPNFQLDRSANPTGVYTVQLTVIDDEGGTSIPYITRILVGTNGVDNIVVTDADFASGNELLVVALDGADVIDATDVSMGNNVAVIGGEGADLMFGGAGNDTFYLAEGDDSANVIPSGSSITLANPSQRFIGDDRYVLTPNSELTIEDPDGDNILDFDRAIFGITFDLNLTDGTQQDVSPTGLDGPLAHMVTATGTFTMLVGSSFGDELTAADEATIDAGAGDDMLYATNLVMGATFNGDDGVDVLQATGNFGDIDFNGDDGADVFNNVGSTGTITFTGGADDDVFNNTTISTATIMFNGGADDDLFVNVGTALSIMFSGGADDDTFRNESTTTGMIDFRGDDGEDVFRNIGSIENLTFTGGADKDLFINETIATGLITFIGDDGADVFENHGTIDGITFNGGADGDEFRNLSTITGTINFTGDDGADIFTNDGSATDIVFTGGADDDLLVNRSTVTGRIDFGGDDGADVFQNDGLADSIEFRGGADDDVFFNTAEVAGAIVFIGGADDNIFQNTGSAGSIDYTGGADDDVFINSGTVVGAIDFGGDDGADVFENNGIADSIEFRGGADDDIFVNTADIAGAIIFNGGADDNIFQNTGAAERIDYTGGADDDIFVNAGTVTGAIDFGGDDGADVFQNDGVANSIEFRGGADDDIFVNTAEIAGAIVFTGGADDNVFRNSGSAGSIVFTGGADDDVFINSGDTIGAINFSGDDGSNVFENVGNALSIDFTGGADDDIFFNQGDVAGKIVFTGGADDDFFQNTGSATDLEFTGGADDDVFVNSGRISNRIDFLGDDGADVLRNEATVNSEIDFRGGGDDDIFINEGDSVGRLTFNGGADDDIFINRGESVRDIDFTGDDENPAIVGLTDDDTLIVNGSGEGSGKVTFTGGIGRDSFQNNATGFVEFKFLGGADDDVFQNNAEGISNIIFTGDDGADVFENNGRDVSGIDFTGDDGADVFVNDGANVSDLVFTGGADDDVFINTGETVSDIVFTGGADDDVFANSGSSVSGITYNGGADSGNDVFLNRGAMVSNVVFNGGLGSDQVWNQASGVEANSWTFNADDGENIFINDGAFATNLTYNGGADDDAFQNNGSNVRNINFGGDDGADVFINTGSIVDNILFQGGADDDIFVNRGERVSAIDFRGDDGADIFENRGRDVMDIVFTGGADDDVLINNGFGTRGIDFTGDDGADVFVNNGDAATDLVFRGGADDDILQNNGRLINSINFTGGGDADLLDNNGSDIDLITFSGDDGADAFVNDGASVARIDFTGGADSDSLRLVGGEFGEVSFDGGLGSDSLVVNAIGAGGSIVSFTGGDDSDLMAWRGSAGSATLDLGSGDDYALVFGSGQLELIGGTGSDYFVFQGNPIADVTVNEDYYGVADTDQDTLDFSSFSGSALDLDLRVTLLQQQSAEFSITLTNGLGIENVFGTAGADTIEGNSQNNLITGAEFQDQSLDPPVAARTDVQWVLLDFDTFTDLAAGEHEYTQPERDAIQSLIELTYQGPDPGLPWFNFEFTQNPAEIPVADYVTINFNETPDFGRPGGEASEVDLGNKNLDGTAVVQVNGLLGGIVTTEELAAASTEDHDGHGFAFYFADLGEGDLKPAATSENFVLLSAKIGAHELGHLLGLRHADSFGPISTGIHSPPGADGFNPSYVGPVGGFETFDHLLSSGASVGSDRFNDLRGLFLGEREAVKLAYALSDPTLVNVDESTVSHSDTVTAQALDFSTVAVPNTLRDGLNAQKAFFVEVVSVEGVIGLQGGISESDFYSFTGRAGELVNIELSSLALRQNGATTDGYIDSVIRVYDSSGALVNYYGSDAVNDDEFESSDSMIIDLLLPTNDTYFIEVDTFVRLTGEPNYQDAVNLRMELEARTDLTVAEQLFLERLQDSLDDTDVGGYQLFVSRFGQANPVDLRDSLKGNGGVDIIIGGPGDSYDLDFEVGDNTTLNAGDTFTRTIVFEDRGASSWTITVDYGNSNETFSINDPEFVLTNPYPLAGNFTVSVTLENDIGTVATDSFDIDVTTPLQAENDQAMTDEDTPIVIDVLDNDTVAGQVSIDVSLPSHGTADVNTDGTITYTPNDNYFGDDSFTYTLDDGAGNTSTATVDVTINPVNDAPTLTLDPLTGVGTQDEKADIGQSITLSGSFIDPDLIDTHLVTIDWGEISDTAPNAADDRTVLNFSVGDPREFNVTHQYDSGGLFDITVTVSDSDNESDSDAATPAWVSGVRLNPDTGQLQIIGTDHEDEIEVHLHWTGDLHVKAELGNGFNFDRLFDAEDVESLLAHLCDGDDEFEMSWYLDIDAVVYGDGGNDVVRTGMGTDRVFGGDGRDIIKSGAGDDYVDAGAGNDRVYGGKSFAWWLPDDDVLIGGPGHDYLFGVWGNDILDGGAGNDRLFGNSGNDILLGRAGVDRLYGGSGNDLLIGGTGKDRLNGQSGNDILHGGTTSNTYAELDAVIAIWTNYDFNYATRVAGVVGVLDLDDDDEFDRMWGSGGKDLFFAGTLDHAYKARYETKILI